MEWVTRAELLISASTQTMADGRQVVLLTSSEYQLAKDYMTWMEMMQETHRPVIAITPHIVSQVTEYMREVK